MLTLFEICSTSKVMVAEQEVHVYLTYNVTSTQFFVHVECAEWILFKTCFTYTQCALYGGKERFTEYKMYRVIFQAPLIEQPTTEKSGSFPVGAVVGGSVGGVAVIAGIVVFIAYIGKKKAAAVVAPVP